MSATEEEIQENQIVTDMEVVIRYFACRHCEIRFDSVENITAHLREEHHTEPNQTETMKEEMEEDTTTTALDGEDYIIVEERQLLSEIAHNPQLLQQLAANQENGQYVLQIIENEHTEEITNVEHEPETSPRKTPKNSQAEERQSKPRSSRKRKVVDKEYFPGPQTRLRKNIKSEPLSDEPQVFHLIQEDPSQIGSNHVGEETVGASKAFEDNENDDEDGQAYPSEYTPTYKAKKGRVVARPDDSSLRKFPCPFQGCNYVAKYRSNLWDHKKTHTGEKPYVCTWPSCSMKFSQTHQLKLHLRSHTGERPYVCDWPGCNSAFSQKPGLKSHMLTHTGEKPFKCDYPGCNWTFRLKGALTDHKRAIHENAKKHICSWPGCNKRFLQHCHLKKHVMGHADIKPFSCDWPNCNYKAVTMAYVSNHRKTHTGEKNYECTYPNCNKRFVKSSHVNRHRARCHPDLYAVISDGTFDEEEDEESGEVLEEQTDISQVTSNTENIPKRGRRRGASTTTLNTEQIESGGEQRQILYKVATDQNGDEEAEAAIYIQSEEVEEEMVNEGYIIAEDGEC